MKAISRKKITPLGVIVSSFGLLTVIVGFSFVSHVSATSSQTANAPNGRIMTIHDRNLQKVVLTKAATMKEALDGAGIVLDKNDTVEPALSEKLVATDYQVNIYRARPVTVVDGASRQKIMTPYQTPAQITRDADVKLYDEDTTVIDRSTDIVAEGAGITLTITRASPFTLKLYGQTIEARSQAKTVGEMLTQKGIKLASNDTLSLDAATPLTAGMTVELWRNGVQTVTEDQPIPFEVQKVQDADREIGYRNVQTPGENGARSVTYEITMQNGQEVGRKEIQSVVTRESKKQVEVVGAKPKFSGNVSAQKIQIMSAVGISPGDYNYVDYIVNRESGWNANSVNASSGACGLPQAYPCSKLGPNWNDPVVSLSWANSYAIGRYGSWSAAYSHWLSANSW
jgi:uncharacterized protein YabE (DUF348 family)